MNKCHNNVGWRNDTTPAINETNLNYMDGCIDTIDDRVVAMDTSKANQSDLLTAMADWNVDNATGDVTITLKNGQTVTRHTNLGKIAINVRVIHDPTDPHYQEMEITMPDGTKDYVDFSAFVTQFEFVDSSEIHASVDSDGEVSFSLVNGSITGEKLQPNYLADVTAQAQAASAAATAASGSASDAADSAEDSEAWAVGQRGGVDVPSTDPTYHNNAKYWKDQAQAAVSSTFAGLEDVELTDPSDGQAPLYDAATGKWKNGNVSVDISGKADKVNGATNGHLAALDSDGNLKDSGIASGDVHTGTLPVNKGGTGATTLASGAALIGNGTGAVQTRAITNNTSKGTAPAGSTNLATMNSLLYGMQNYMNRNNAVNVANADLASPMARGIYAQTTDLTPGTTAMTTGTIVLVYE